MCLGKHVSSMHTGVKGQNQNQAVDKTPTGSTEISLLVALPNQEIIAQKHNKVDTLCTGKNHRKALERLLQTGSKGWIMKKTELSNLNIQPTKFQYSSSNDAKHRLMKLKKNNAKVDKKERK